MGRDDENDKWSQFCIYSQQPGESSTCDDLTPKQRCDVSDRSAAIGSDVIWGVWAEPITGGVQTNISPADMEDDLRGDTAASHQGRHGDLMSASYL